MNNMTELDKLEAYLKEKGIKYKRVDEDAPVYMRIALERDPDLKGLGERHQIVVCDEGGNRVWDAICHYGSFGYEAGLLEIMGSPVVRGSDESEVVGHLTAQDVIDRLENISPEQKKDDTISRQAAIDALLMERDKKLRSIEWYDPYSESECGGIIEALSIIRNLPSAQPKIIYCKDCKHNLNSPEAGNACCDTFYGMTDQYGFCYIGERREDND